MNEKGQFFFHGIFFLFLMLLLTGCGVLQVEIDMNHGEDGETITPEVLGETSTPCEVGDSQTSTPRTTSTQITPTPWDLALTSTPTPCDQAGNTAIPTVWGYYSSLRGLVYRKGDEIWMVNEVDQEQYLFNLPEGWIPGISLSPDNNYLLYAVSRGGVEDVWASALLSGETRNLTNSNIKIEQNPIWWLTDPMRILFGYFEDKEDVTMGYGFLGSINLIGEDFLSLLDETMLGFFPAPSPDGQTISLSDGNNAWFFKMDIGLEAFNSVDYGISVNRYYDSSWSPDGTKLAWFIRHSVDGENLFSLAIFNLVDKNVKVLHSYKSAGCGWYRNPLLWSPDGKWITFVEYCPEGRQDSRFLLLEVISDTLIDMNQINGPQWKDARTLAYNQDGGIRLFHLDKRQHEPLVGFEGAHLIGWFPLE